MFSFHRLIPMLKIVDLRNSSQTSQLKKDSFLSQGFLALYIYYYNNIIIDIINYLNASLIPPPEDLSLISSVELPFSLPFSLLAAPQTFQEEKNAIKVDFR